ncbi:MAG: GNAT family N-acetyltransferase [Cyanobacteria bacterium P01_A01_bin.40]
MINDHVEINIEAVEARGIKFSILKAKQEIARAFLYIMSNELHAEPFGLVEDVYVNQNYRSHGLGTKIVQLIIKEAKAQGCYKLIATSRKSRPKVHKLYEKLGFEEKGFEFRMDLSVSEV